MKIILYSILVYVTAFMIGYPGLAVAAIMTEHYSKDNPMLIIIWAFSLATI